MHDNIFFDKSKLKHLGKNVIIGKTVRIRNPDLVSIGDNCIIDDFTYISGGLILGDGVHIGSNTTFQGGNSTIHVGHYTGISSGCRVFAVSSDYLSSDIDLPTLPDNVKFMEQSTLSENVYIGRACLIGANSIILPGVQVPDGCSFGALSKIRNKNYTEYSFYSDECRNVIAKRNKQKLINILKKLNCYDE